MGKRRQQPHPAPAEAFGEQMLIREVEFSPGELKGQPMLLLRCVVNVPASAAPKVITIGVPEVDVDAFLVAVQQGVAGYKEHNAREGH